MSDPTELRVSRQDREEAAEFAWADGDVGTAQLRYDIRHGLRDDHRAVQAFARHRIATERDHLTTRGQVREALERLVKATYIRALRGRDHVPSMREEQDARSQARKALAALSTPDTGDGWQDVSTAPKDGSQFLAYSQDVAGHGGSDPFTPFISLCAWHPSAGFCTHELMEPTHWRPLPAAPPRKDRAMTMREALEAFFADYEANALSDDEIGGHVLALRAALSSPDTSVPLGEVERLRIGLRHIIACNGGEIETIENQAVLLLNFLDTLETSGEREDEHDADCGCMLCRADAYIDAGLVEPKSDSRPVGEAERDVIESALYEAGFLADRIDELDWSQSIDDLANQHSGHVDPPLARLKRDLDELAAIRAALTQPATSDDGERRDKYSWQGEGPEPRRWAAADGTIVYRSYEDYCDD